MRPFSQNRISAKTPVLQCTSSLFRTGVSGGNCEMTVSNTGRDTFPKLQGTKSYNEFNISSVTENVGYGLRVF